MQVLHLFASDSFYLVKSWGLKAPQLFGILNPSGQISLIWAKNKILRNKKAHSLHTRMVTWKEFKFETTPTPPKNKRSLRDQGNMSNSSNKTILESLLTPCSVSCVAFSCQSIFTGFSHLLTCIDKKKVLESTFPHLHLTNPLHLNS